MISQTVLSIIDKTEKNGDFLAYRLQIVSKAGGSWLASSDFTFRMFYTEKIHWITKCFLLSVLILAPLCSAQDEIELNLENHDGIPPKPPRRRLLYSNYSTSMGEVLIYVIATFVLTIIAACCKYCMKQGCVSNDDDYSDAVLHRPPRIQNPTVPVAPTYGRSVLNPPRSSSSVILPPGERLFSVDLMGIENPSYNHSFNDPVHNYYPPSVLHFSSPDPNIVDPTTILDLPPSYESAIKEKEFPKVN